MNEVRSESAYLRLPKEMNVVVAVATKLFISRNPYKRVHNVTIKGGGRLDFCITNKERALLQIVNFTSLPETRLVRRF